MRAETLRPTSEQASDFSSGLLDLTDSYCCAVDGEGRLRYANPASAHLMGHGVNLDLRPRFVDAMRVASADLTEHKLREAGKSKGVVEWSARHLRDEGDRGETGREVRWRACLDTARGWILLSGQDVTEVQQQFEEDLADRERRYQALVAGSIQGIVVLRHRQVLFANRAFACTFGFSDPAEIVALPSVDHLLAPYDAERPTGRGGPRLLNRCGPDCFLFEGVRKDGRRIWLECVTLAIDWEGEAALQATVFDVTEYRRAEAELQAHQRLLQTVFDTVPHLLFVKDKEFNYLMTNAAWRAFHQSDEERQHDRHNYALQHRPLHERENAYDLDREAMRSGGTVYAEYERTTTAGDKRQMRTFRSPLRDANGAIVGVVGISEDITERKAAARDYHNGQRLLRSVLDTLPGWLSVKDKDGRYLIVNEGWKCAHALKDKDVIGKHVTELWGLTPEVANHVAELDEEILSGAKPFTQHPCTRSYLSGETQHMLGTRAPIYGDGGEIAGVVCVALDITEQQRKEDEVKAGRQLLRTVIDALPLWVFLKDRDQRMVMLNRRMEEDLKVSEDDPDFESSYYRNLNLAPESRQRLEDAERRALAGETVYITGTEVRLPNGQLRRGRSIRAPLRDGDGNVTGVVAVSEDITERERAEQAMLQAQKLESLGVLAGGIAHDFNNLLVTVLGYANLASMELPPDSPVRPLMNQIETAGLRASELCTQMLAYAGKGSFQVSRVQFNELIEEMVELIRVSLSRNVELHFELAPESPVVDVDPTQIRQVVMNLLINASEALQDGVGTVTLRTGTLDATADDLRRFAADSELQEGCYAYLEVADNGGGMDAETLQRMFEPFFTTKFTGRGLGLAAVMGIVRGHAGGIRVESSPGQGTTFRVLLPSVAAESPLALAEAEWSGSDFEAEPKSVAGGAMLVIDDEESIRELAELALGRLGFQVVCAEHGEAGLREAQRMADRLCLVLLDVTMPGMSGEETLGRLEALGVKAPVIIMSGHGATELKKRFQGLPVADILPKPFTGAAFRAKVEQVLRAVKD